MNNYWKKFKAHDREAVKKRAMRLGVAAQQATLPDCKECGEVKVKKEDTICEQCAAKIQRQEMRRKDPRVGMFA